MPFQYCANTVPVAPCAVNFPLQITGAHAQPFTRRYLGSLALMSEYPPPAAGFAAQIVDSPNPTARTLSLSASPYVTGRLHE